MTQEINIDGEDEYTLDDIEVGDTVRVKPMLLSSRIETGEVTEINNISFTFDTSDSDEFDKPLRVHPRHIIEIL